MPRITHFDIPADDVGRAKKFYSELFNWRIEGEGGPVEYYMVMTGEKEGEAGIDGGIGPRGGRKEGIITFVDVPSIDETLAAVKRLGGAVVQPKMAVPQRGYTAVFSDSEGNPMGLWETDENAQ